MISIVEKIEFDGAKLKELRGSKSQASIAKLVGISRQALRQIENGETKPSADTLVRLCAILNISITDLSKNLPCV